MGRTRWRFMVTVGVKRIEKSEEKLLNIKIIQQLKKFYKHFLKEMFIELNIKNIA